MTRIVTADSHHEKWYRPPQPKYDADAPAWDPDNPDASRWKMPPPNQVKHNEMAEVSVLAMIGHDRVESCEVEYDHATKRRICRLGIRDLTDDEIAEIRTMRGVEVSADVLDSNQPPLSGHGSGNQELFRPEGK